MYGYNAYTRILLPTHSRVQVFMLNVHAIEDRQTNAKLCRHTATLPTYGYTADTRLLYIHVTDSLLDAKLADTRLLIYGHVV